MKNNSKTIATIALVIIGIAILFLVYYFFFRPPAGNQLIGEGLITDSQPVDRETPAFEPGRGDFLHMLADLRSISFRADFMRGREFLYLEETPLFITAQTPGRENPFAPVE
jgi:hypothetical protein